MNKKILILHGWDSNSERWQRVKELLEEKGMEVLVLELPGFGQTSPPPNPWGRNDYLNWIFQKIKEKNLQKFNLLGHSFGGGLAAKMAAENPNLIDKLILCAPAVIKRKSIKTNFFYWVASFGKKIFSQPCFKVFYPHAQKLIYTLAGAKDYYLATGVMKETMKKITKEEGLETILEKIKIPTLILWGKKDDVLPLKNGYRIKEKIEGSEFRIIPKAKHSPHQETPEELAKLIYQFLQ